MFKKILFSILLISILALPVHAQVTIVPDECSGPNAATECGVNEFLVLLINISRWILAVLGSVALAMFVYGGFLWLTAGGVASRVEHGRNILIGTVIGIIIVLGAFVVIDFLGKSLGVSTLFGRYLGP